MRLIWRTLLLVALCVQLPLAALASYETHVPHEHHHSHPVGVESHDYHLTPASELEPSGGPTECGSEHQHCAGSHVILLLQTSRTASVDSLSQAFDVCTGPALPTELMPSIERPKWANI